jgi:very-short-patch-repair endonuclease
MDGSVTKRCAELAERQSGVVSREQLRRLGVSDDVVDAWLQHGRIHRLHRGVYAYGHRLIAPRGRWWAAVLTCGRGAVLSHRSAGGLWELLGAFRETIEVTTPRRVRQRGIQVHQNRLHRADVTTHEDSGIPATTPARTLIDLAAVVPPRTLERALDQAEVLRLLPLDALETALHRAPRRPGTAALRQLMEPDRARTFTRSELEEAFLALLRSRGLPEPLVNQRVHGVIVDFHWPRARLIVETDGGRFHDTARRARADKRRDARLLAEGWRTIRFAHADVMGDAAHVTGVLASVFAAAT